MINKPLGDHPRHEPIRVTLPLEGVKPQREREGVGEVIGRGGREAIGGVGHCASVAGRLEQDKNISARGQGSYVDRC